MKKLVLLFILPLILTMCEKEESKICWTCLTVKIDPTSRDPNIPKGFNRILTQDYCNKTEKEIQRIEELGTFYHNVFGISWHQTTVCTLKIID